MSAVTARPLTVAESVVDLIGGTPMVKLKKIATPDMAEIWAKCEFMNPGGSVKDRLGLGLILDAERDGKIKPGVSTLIEATAGNTGIGLALVGAARGYKVVICMPEKYSMEKRMVVAALGATLVVTPLSEGMEGAMEKARQLEKEIPGGFVTAQYENPSNPRAHELTTGPEIWEQTGGRVDAIAIGVGSGGTFVGVARYLTSKNPKIVRVAVETQNSILTGTPGKHRVEGIGMSFLPDFWDESLVDEAIAITDEEAFACVKELARVEGFLVGSSSGANVAAARRVARRLGPGKRVVTLLPDSAERYMSQGILS
jgi:cysteine synthase A